MDVFMYLASRTIRRGPDDRRELALYGPFARPYDVSGPDTEERIVRRLASAYRALLILVPAMVTLLFLRSDVHSFFRGLAAVGVIGWLVVRAFLRPELRWLPRVERPSGARVSDDAFAEQLEPSERALLRGRRQCLLALFLGACLYSVCGLAIAWYWPAFGYPGAVFFGFAAIRWWRMLRLPPETLLEMKAIDGFESIQWSRSAPPAPREMAKPAPRRAGLEPEAGLWDPEIDGWQRRFGTP